MYPNVVVHVTLDPTSAKSGWSSSGPVHLPARLAEGMCGPEHVHLIDGVRIHGVGGFLGAKVGLLEMPFQRGMEPVDYWRS